MKRIMIVTCSILLAIGLSAMPAFAYTTLSTAVTITASGTLAGDTKTFAAQVVGQGTEGTPGTSISFTSPNGLTDSGKALKITGGTNEVNARIIIYTDNNSQFSLPPEINPATGADGGGLVGQTNKGYAVAMFWGMKSGADYEPNANSDYVFGDPAAPVNGSTGNCNYIVDKRHTATYCTKNGTLDNQAMYPASGPETTVNKNTANDGVYPQLWDIDMRTAASGGGSLIPEAEALYKNIATVAFNVGTGGTDDPNNYICTAPKLTTAGPGLSGDNVKAKLLKLTGAPSGSDAYLYLPIGADFRGVPAQVYSTSALIVEMVKG